MNPVRYVADSFATFEGDGVPIRRALPSRAVKRGDVDPMLLLDHFVAPPRAEAGQGFPEHPHRGFEIITYLLSGRISDQTGDGRLQRIQAGGLQEITAGLGIRHGGGPMEPSPEQVEGLQIWINLAKKDKHTPPDYRLLEPAEIPQQRLEGATLRLLAGEGTPLPLLTPVQFADASLESGAALSREIPAGYQGYAYVLRGEGSFGGQAAKATQIVVLGGGTLEVKAGSGGLRFLLAVGKPHGEPVMWNGPFVD